MRTVITILLLLYPQTTQHKSEPPAHVSCVMRNQQEILVHRDGTNEMVDDWMVDCTLSVGEHRIWAGPLPLAHPAPFSEASGAVEQFRTVKAPQLVKEWRRGR